MMLRLKGTEGIHSILHVCIYKFKLLWYRIPRTHQISENRKFSEKLNYISVQKQIKTKGQASETIRFTRKLYCNFCHKCISNHWYMINQTEL